MACLAPGILDEGMGSDVIASKFWPAYRKRIAADRPGTVREAARAAVFLAGPDASYITSTVLHVHGGIS